jgi:hypothetical protein
MNPLVAAENQLRFPEDAVARLLPDPVLDPGVAFSNCRVGFLTVMSAVLFALMTELHY